MIYVVLGFLVIALIVIGVMLSKGGPSWECQGFDNHAVCACTRCSVPGKRGKY